MTAILMITSWRRESNSNMAHAISASSDESTDPTQTLTTNPQTPIYPPQQVYPSHYVASQIKIKSRSKAGLFAIFLGMFGVHKFYLGYTSSAWIMLGISIAGIVTLVGWILTIPIIGIIGFIEGIIYLVKSDDEFEQIYVQGHRPWF